MAATKQERAKSSGVAESVASVGSGIGGLAGVFSSWTLCHNICIAVIALLALIGVTVIGMPLLFLQKVAVPLWTAAVAIFAVLLLLKFRRMGCISSRALTLNAGLIVAGTPFQQLQPFSKIFLVAGGALVGLSIILIVKDKVARKTKARAVKAKLGGEK